MRWAAGEPGVRSVLVLACLLLIIEWAPQFCSFWLLAAHFLRMLRFSFFGFSFSVRVRLRPRVIKFKRRQKLRSWRFGDWFSRSLCYGNSGLILLQTAQLTSRKLSGYKLFLKKAASNPLFTSRGAWIFAFPHFPVTKKAENARMGKGKGKAFGFFTDIASGCTIAELRNLRKGRSDFFLKRLGWKLGVKTARIYASNSMAQAPFSTSRQIFFYKLRNALV